MKIALIGYGKMGRAIEAVAVAQKHEIVQRFDADNALSVAGLASADVAIEFSAPHAAAYNISLCMAAGVPVVVGTTGWYDALDTVRQQCAQHGGAVLSATNFSLGVHIFFKMNEILAQIMDKYPQYNPEIIEIHQIDAPSGTAITTAEKITNNLTRKTQWQHGTTTDAHTVGIESHRTDDVPGTHTVHYTSIIDTLTLTHTAHNRSGFAHGAVQAAAWLIGKKGYFTIDDMLKF
jgi:4-hydroxy-tetrahydrodipicolinate reductase